MTLDQILTLNQIVTHKSFAKAAKSMNKTQPSLSVAIKKLEDEFGFTLFDRSTYRPTLTKSGNIFHEKAKIIMAEFHELSKLGNELGKNYEHEVTLGIEGVVDLRKITKIIAQLKNQCPNIMVKIQADYVWGTWNKVTDKKLDIGITPVISENEEVFSRPIDTVKLVPVISSQHSMHGRLSNRELRKLPQVVVSDSSENSHSSFGLLAGAPKCHVSDFNTKKHLIMEGLGWGRLPQFMIENHIDKKKLITIQNKEINSRVIDVYAVKNNSVPLGPAAQILWGLLESMD